jgi:hypothetical protein
MLWKRLRKALAATSLAALCGGVAANAQNVREPVAGLNYMALGEMAARYCEVYKCSVDLPPAAMSYPIIAPYYNSENKTYLEAQLRAFAFERNYSCSITKAKISCVEKKNDIAIIDSSSALWNVVRVNREDVELYRRSIINNQAVNLVDTFTVDTASLKSSHYLYTIKVMIQITEFDLSYKRVKASYISDFYSSDFSFSSGMKYGTTIKELSTTQTAENGTMTSSYNDKLQGLQISGNVITITANNRDLEVGLFGGSQELLQVRKECMAGIGWLRWFGFNIGCGLVQTEIFVSLE